MSTKTTAAKRPAVRKNSTAPKKAAKRAISSSAKRVTSQARKPAAKKGSTKAGPVVTPAELSHRLHLLLHSIHQIERYEERLCSIADAVRRTGRLNAVLLQDLQTLIEELPANEFLHDLDAVRNAVQP